MGAARAAGAQRLFATVQFDWSGYFADNEALIWYELGMSMHRWMLIDPGFASYRYHADKQ